ncbi:hypothetical protein BDQ17DRAFT_1429069 [Cyathus striatus]|nr:hypothetical protein BDQ17DRAFT_1429069 [Cyathus striatus]
MFEIKAAEADTEHKIKFPGYVFSPEWMSAKEKEALKLLRKGGKKPKKVAGKGKARNAGSRELFLPYCGPQFGEVAPQIYQSYVEASTSLQSNTQQVVRSLDPPLVTSRQLPSIETGVSVEVNLGT